MTETLHLKLLGKPQVTLGETPLTKFGTAKAEALLYYLTVTGHPHSREALVDLLWGEMAESKAKRNLTTTLSTLRKIVESYLLIEPHHISFNSDAPHWLDIIHFQDTIQSIDEDTETETLRQAVDLYQGDFLEGVYVKNALVFEEWLLTQRERLRELMLEGLDALVAHYINRAEYNTGISYATRLLELDPWRESAHRQMMILLARSGQRSAALAQYETCRQILDEELGVEPMAETTALYERLKGTQEPLPHNLPPQPNAFVGRVRAMNQLVAHLDNPDCRLLTLVGPGGIGKTRLAIEGGRQYVQSDQVFGGATFLDGIYFVNLAPITLTGITNGETSRLSQISNLVASAIADAFEFSFHGPTDLMVQLLNHLRQKEMLLILDNFEHLVEATDLLADLLQRASQIKLLVTSRERLNLMEEWVMEIEGLEFPTALPLEEPGLEWAADLESYSAIALFVRQAQQVRVDFTLSEAEAPHIVRLCQLVEGIPLTLVLAASWLRVLTCAEIVQEIEQSLDFLTASQRNIPERHRSMRAVFDQSWQMLSDQEQAVFRKISVFWGGFLREAAQEVAGASLPILTSLVDKSLLHLTASGRYEIHELLRQYAAEKLARISVEQEATQDAHCRYYARFLRTHQWQLAGYEGLAKFSEISAELDNIRACWQRTIVPGRTPAVTEIIQCVWSLSYFYARSGMFQEGYENFGQVAERLAAENASTPFNLQQQMAYGKVLLARATFLFWLGDLKRASGLIQKGLLVLQQFDKITKYTERDQGLAYLLLGMAAWQRGNYLEAEKRLGEGLLFFKTVSDPFLEARSNALLGAVACELGQYTKAEQLLQKAISAFEALGEFWFILHSLDYLARVKYALGKPLNDIRQTLQENLDTSRETGNLWLIVQALKSLGATLNLMGGNEQVEAKQLLQEGVVLCRELNMTWSMVPILHLLGLTTMALGDYQAAKVHLREALEISISSQFTPVTLEILVGLAALWVKQHSLSQEHQKTFLTLATLVFNHPASNRQNQDKAAQLLAEMEKADLPPGIVTTAKERGQAITLEEMVEEILNESNENI